MAKHGATAFTCMSLVKCVYTPEDQNGKCLGLVIKWHNASDQQPCSSELLQWLWQANSANWYCQKSTILSIQSTEDILKL